MSTLQIKQVLIFLVCGLFALFMGPWIVDGNWRLPLFFFLIGGYLFLTKAAQVTPETYMLSFLVFGYIVGNRGFAQITPLGNLPLFMGELGLIVGTVFLAIHISLKKEFSFRLDALGIAILIWMIVGTIRVVFDYPNYGILALRDFAMVYYAAFFFIAQPMAKHTCSRKIFEKIFQTALFLLIPGFLLFKTYPEFFHQHLIFDGTPLIFYKGDLAASFLGIGFVYHYCKYDSTNMFKFLLLAYLFLILTIYTTMRAAWVGLAFILILIIFTKKLNVIKHVCVAIIILILPLVVYMSIFTEDIKQTRPYAVYEHLISMTDISGTGNYSNIDSIGSGANNRFRLIWWRTVINQTLDHGLIFGLGFGYNLTDQFYQKYYNVIEQNFAVRSPHGFILSVFGRMGLLGLGLFIFIISAMLIKTYQELYISRKSKILTLAFPYWCVSWVLFLSACFGVVLEGPMGAITFWILLGVSNSLSNCDTENRKYVLSQILSRPMREQTT